MASTRLLSTKDGRPYYEIRCHKRGRGEKTMRWFVPDGWSERAVQHELSRQVSAFENDFLSGNILTRDEDKAARAAEEAERAKLKTFRQYAEGVYLPAKALETSENTKASYKSNLELHIFPVFGDVLLTDVTPAMITKLLLNYMENHAHASTIKVYNIINGVFEMAFLDDSIPINPMLKVKRPKQPKDEKGNDQTQKALDVNGLRHVCSCVANEPMKWRAFIELAADTGCRRGELCALEWKDVDLENGLVTIKRNLQYTAGKGVYFTTPKSGKTREVDIGEDMVALLRKWKKEQQKICICKYVFNPERSNQFKHVAQDQLTTKRKTKKTIPIENMPMNPQSPTRYFKLFGEKYNVPGFHPHLLRHTSASVAITNGADVASVSARLGHADPSTTMRMYTHANEESIRRAGQVVRDALKAAGGER